MMLAAAALGLILIIRIIGERVGRGNDGRHGCRLRGRGAHRLEHLGCRLRCGRWGIRGFCGGVCLRGCGCGRSVRLCGIGRRRRGGIGHGLGRRRLGAGLEHLGRRVGAGRGSGLGLSLCLIDRSEALGRLIPNVLLLSGCGRHRSGLCCGHGLRRLRGCGLHRRSGQWGNHRFGLLLVMLEVELEATVTIGHGISLHNRTEQANGRHCRPEEVGAALSRQRGRGRSFHRTGLASGRAGLDNASRFPWSRMDVRRGS